MSPEVIDSKGLSDKSYPISVEAYLGPYIEQSASLSNDVEISYSATLHKINNAELKVNKNCVFLRFRTPIPGLTGHSVLI